MDNRKEVVLRSISFIVRIILGVVFIWASFDKILDPKSFAEIIHNYKILPSQMVNLPALVLPWIELACGILLIIGVFPKGSALIINCLLVVFIIALGSVLYRGLDIRCGCFTLSSDANNIAAVDLIIDGVLLSLGLWVLFSEKNNLA